MKKIKLTFLIIVTALPLISRGQQAPKFVYCQIVGYAQDNSISPPKNIKMEFGENMKFFADNRMKDGSGKALVFNSIIDALNYMGKTGWEFVQAYVTQASGGSYTRFLIRKQFDELDDEVKKEFSKN
jgi:hypothetical protein